MINKKINRLLSSILGVALIGGIIQIPAFADDNVQVTSSYSSSDNLTNDQTNIANKDKNIEQNGLKISVNKIIASKHKLRATIIIKNENSFDKTKRPNAQVLLSYGDNKLNGESTSSNYTDDKTLVISITRTINKGELPKKGPLRIDLVIPTYKINLGIDENMDFSEAFKDSIEKDLSINVPDCNFTINKLESDLLGTHITYSKPEKDSSDRNYSLSEHPNLILKTGDKMYLLRPSGSYSSNVSGNGKDNKVTLGGYEAEAANYEKIKDQSNISMIPIICTMNSNELENYYKETYKNQKNSIDDTINKDILNNVYYNKALDFSDGTKGEIYNIERNNDVIKVYCKGATEKESLLMASNTNIRYKSDESKTYNNYYSGNSRITLSKDPKESLGYIIEFTGVDKDKTMQLTCDTIIKQIDKFKLGTEIQISK
ncbi:hypothetical protein psyc5s11_20710 [Clostridium gelidum]|uniref:DUF4179 domain-containing protein n=1 Tax=Clostridium gelidum TaxID=704125 RepID=A0ABM7T256_9CLOT|nr:hypothetical protein [Clostridium gelidum]BCZ46004.1 hypothetical protein psyc5s11_20710 [Clostridium gelidum]